VIDRILSFLGVQVPGADEEWDPAEISECDAEAALRAVLGEELGSFARSLVEEGGSEGGDSSNLYAMIQKMTVFQKIKLARLGNTEARGLLVKDRNKVVAISAISSPKISTNEVIGIAQSRNVHDEVLRMIALNRLWTRAYRVKHALATNPKCPQVMAMKFVNYLQDQDLKAIMKSKDVPTAVSTHARRALMKKGKI